MKNSIRIIGLSIALFFSAFLSNHQAKAQDGVWTDTVSVAADSAAFDFWVGHWDLTWKDPDGKTGKGENNIVRILNGKVIQENFKAKKGAFKGYLGMSVSAYNPQNKQWKQTWVDSSGGYLDFSGFFGKDGRKYFARSIIGPKGNTVWQRMVFYNVSDKAMDWDWEVSTDGGKTWKLNWRIHYEKKKQ